MIRQCVMLLMATVLCGALQAQDAKSLYDEGVKLKMEKKSAAALEKFKMAVQLKPGYIEAMYEMGWCQNDVKNYTGAIATLRKVVPVWKTIPKAHYELAYAFEKTGLDDSAVFYYNRTMALKPDYSGIHRQLGYIAYNKDDYTTALAEFQKYEEIVKTPITDYLYWYRKGFSLNARQMYEAAKTALKKSLEFKTDYINTYLELGFACTKLKQDADAIAWFEKANAIDPKSHIPYNGIAEVYRDNKKDMDMAMTWYMKTLALNSKERKANFGMGYCLNSKGKYAEAIPYLRQAIASEATYTAAFVELGYSLFKTGSYTEAVTNLNKAVTLNPKNENARFYACLLYIEQKNKTKAQQMVDELKALNSKHVNNLQEKVNRM